MVTMHYYCTCICTYIYVSECMVRVIVQCMCIKMYCVYIFCQQCMFAVAFMKVLFSEIYIYFGGCEDDIQS